MQGGHRAREWVEGTHPPRNDRRWQRPIDLRLMLVDLGGIAHAFNRLHHRLQCTCLGLAQGLHDHAGAKSGQLVMERACGVGGRNRERFDLQHVAGVQTFVHLHDGDAGLLVSSFDRAVNRCRSAPARQQ